MNYLRKMRKYFVMVFDIIYYFLENLSALAPILAILITILICLYNKGNEDNIRFTDNFNEIYLKTFSLRKELEDLIKPKTKCGFYYELDLICSNEIVEERVLDYLTELENFFTLIVQSKGSKLNKTFEKLVSIAFYQRITALYTYIIYKRRATNNKYMFLDFDDVIGKMRRYKKIKNNIEPEQNKCYVGIRESDIIFSDKYFNEKICLFQKDSIHLPFRLRLNQNIDNKDILPYYQRAISKQKKKMHFIFYNQASAYNYPKEIIKRTICLNEQEILNLLNNKCQLKKWFVNHSIPIIEYETFMGREILISKLSQRFPEHKTFVVQCCRGGGGIGTYVFDYANARTVMEQIEPLQQYIVSPYIPNVSVNTHIFIAEKQTILSPGSIQIIEQHQAQLCYRGCDFIAFRDLSNQVKEKIKYLSLLISDHLREEGYRGIAGIDFIVDRNENVYCSEVNPRFQASTLLLDKYLDDKKNNKNKLKLEAASTFELNEMAFSGNMISTLCFDDEINYSCYYYYSDGINTEFYKDKMNLYRQQKGITTYDDGLEYYTEHNLIDDNSYLSRTVFPHAICKISPDCTLWISDNIRVCPPPADKLSLKIALLNQGVRLEGAFHEIKEGTYNSIDIKVKPNAKFYEEIYINCAYKLHLSQYSPFKIKKEMNQSILYYYNEKMADIEVENNLLSNFPEREQKILYLATDRLRIKIISGCENKNMGKGCKFCNVPISIHNFSLDEICTALKHFQKTEIPFRHILIGGGSCLEPESWDKIITLCRWLKGDEYYKDKPISLMSMIPPKDILTKLKDAGIEEVAFNIEVANEVKACQLMPGKHHQGKEAYYDVLNASVKIFECNKVRSTLLVGLDKEQDLYDEIITLAEMGVVPCLSAFRALPDTEYEGGLPPTNQYLYDVYNNATALLQNIYGDIHELGPECEKCRNNMLTI